jgi:hypothetical protein
MPRPSHSSRFDMLYIFLHWSADPEVPTPANPKDNRWTRSWDPKAVSRTMLPSSLLR